MDSFSFTRNRPSRRYNTFYRNVITPTLKYTFLNSPKLRKINIPLNEELDVLPLEMFHKYPNRYENLHINFTEVKASNPFRPGATGEERTHFRLSKSNVLCLKMLEKYLPNGKQTIVFLFIYFFFSVAIQHNICLCFRVLQAKYQYEVTNYY